VEGGISQSRPDQPRTVVDDRLDPLAAVFIPGKEKEKEEK